MPIGFCVASNRGHLLAQRQRGPTKPASGSDVLRPTRGKGGDVVKRRAKNHLAVVFFISGKVQLRADGDQALKKELGVLIMRPW